MYKNVSIQLSTRHINCIFWPFISSYSSPFLNAGHVLTKQRRPVIIAYTIMTPARSEKKKWLNNMQDA